MIKLVIFSLFLFSTVLAASQSGKGDESSAIILTDEYALNPDGTYQYKYETSNGISASQSGGENGLYANGYFSYLDPNGNRVAVTYLADENGFQPQGDHLPVEPPAPDHVIQTLELIRASATPDSGLDIATLDATIARLKATQGR
ncbi:cuticle protein AMP1A-like [Topomyia yanbarensis]|uniref:cuticle protein AMP1A-like n=1 Tax=Topomyia yanbarensis TaxID=2498891 RepID=UPI00273CBFF3|nr:cuticle protein AMP1A-like [Topomyia yanbarensis]